MLKIGRSVFVLLSLLTALLVAQTPVSAMSNCGDELKQVVAMNRRAFKVTRGLSHYREVFDNDVISPRAHFKFREAFQRLASIPLAHWIDMGAGDCNAIRDFYSLGYPGALTVAQAQLIRTTAISYEVGSKDTLPPSSLLHLLDGRYFQNILDQEIIAGYGLADLITDVFGILPYVEDPSLVLARYLRLLKPDGELFLHMGDTSGTGEG